MQLMFGFDYCTPLYSLNVGLNYFYPEIILNFSIYKGAINISTKTIAMYVIFEVFTAMPSSGMLRHMVLVKTDVSEECSASIIRVTQIDELGTTLVVNSNRRTLRRNTIYSL
jgi:hypothetical protein